MSKVRFIKQLLMILLFLLVANTFNNSGYERVALAIIIFLILVLPASFAVNAVYDNFFEMINPNTLVRLVLTVKYHYIVAVGLMGLAVLLSYFLATSTGVLFLLALPTILYLLVLFFRILGVGVYSQKEKFLESVNFSSDKELILENSDRDKELFTLLEKVYTLLKNGNEEEAEKVISPVAKLYDWSRFEIIFSRMSSWPSNKLTVKPSTSSRVLFQRKRYAEGLKYCQWCLKKDKNFSIGSYPVLAELVLRCDLVDQYETTVQLIENFVTENPQHQHVIKLLTVAADICQGKLHNESKYLRIMAKMESF